MRRIGKFYVIEERLKESGFAETLADMRFVPVRVGFFYDRNEFEFIGYSRLFDEIGYGHKAPTYDIETQVDEDGTYLECRVMRASA